MSRTLIVTPANDMDSILSFAIAAKVWENPMLIYCSVGNHERTKDHILDELDKETGTVVFLDCSLNNDCMKEISRNPKLNTAIVVFDHHPDSRENCRGIPCAGVIDSSSPSTIRLMLRCLVLPLEVRGNAELFALLAENEFVNSAKNLCLAVKKMIFSETRYGMQVAARLRTACDLLDPKCKHWDTIYQSIPDCIKEDEDEKVVAAKLAKHARMKIVNGIKASIVYLTTDAIDKVFMSLPASDALIGWKISEDGNMVRCRIRSRNGVAQKLAKFLGGNGHADAAAADMTLEYFCANVMIGEKSDLESATEQPAVAEVISLPKKKRILRPSSLPLEKNKDVLTAVHTLKSAYKLNVSDKKLCDYFGGVDTIQNCMGQARSLSIKLLGKDRPFVGYVYIVAYSILGDFDKVDAAIEEAFSRQEVIRLIEATKPKSPCPPVRVWMIAGLVISSANTLSDF